MSQVCQLTSELESVTVYRRGARVSRRGVLPTSGAVVAFAGLPVGLEDDSVEIELEGAPDTLKAHQVSVKLGLPEQTEINELGKELKEARAAVAVCRAEARAQQRLIEALYEFSPISRPRGVPGDPPPPQQLEGSLTLLKFRESQLDKMLKEHKELRIAQKKAEEHLCELESKAMEGAPKARPEELRKIVEVHLSHESESEVEILLSYRVQGARWAPAYSLRLNDEMTSSEFSMRALVAQSTEEDWNGVKVAVSTADPLEWRECPQLKSKRIGRAQHAPRSNWRPPPLGTAALFQDYQNAIKTLRMPKPVPPPPPAPSSAPVSRPAGLMSQVMHFDALEEQDDCWVDDEFDEGMLFGGVAASAAPPPPASAPRAGAGGSWGAERKRSAVMKKRKMVKEESAWLDKRIQVSEVKRLDNRLQQYGRLRMMPANDPRQGSLVWQESTALYMEASISLSVISVAIQHQQGLVQTLHSLTLPNGYRVPGAMEGFDYLYKSRGKVSVPADGQFHSIPLEKLSLRPQVKLIAVPRETPDVFRTVTLENDSENGFCQGPVDVFVGDDFLHTTPLKNVGPKETFHLGLGATETVKIKRQTQFKEGTSGLMGGTLSLPHSIDYEVANSGSMAIRLELRERLPEVDEEHKKELKIEIDTVSPQWEKFEQEESPDLKSAYRWNLEIGPGDTVKARVSYTITTNSKYELVGGNRREALS